MLLAAVSVIRKTVPYLRVFSRAKGGNITILFAAASVAIFAGFGASFDLASAYMARQRLSQVATLTCQFSTRPSVAQTATSTYSGTNGFQTYVTSVNAFAAKSLGTQHWSGPLPTGTNATANSYFTATAAAGGTAATAKVPSNPVVQMTASVQTTFAKIFHVDNITVSTRIACQTLANVPQIVTAPTMLKEGFETGCTNYCFTNPSGGSTPLAGATNVFPAGSGYTGYNGFDWYIVGRCLETDHVGVINSSVPEGSVAAELDCDNGSGSAGNSSISTKVYFPIGQYELRYNYRARIDYPDYDPIYICGSTEGDVSWANAPSTGWGWYGTRTNQINVYLDANITGTNGDVGAAPLHKTLDGSQYLAGSNLIDVCVYSPTWIERSVKFKVTNPGYYWLSFAADGNNDSYGGQIDNIRLCQKLCDGTLQDDFPASWLAANNGGSQKVLFEDTFESPVYTQDPYTSSKHAKGGNLAKSYGTSGTSASGWPNQSASGWATAPYNEVNYWMQGASQGNQYISLQGWNGFSNSSDPINRAISRSFVLDPGYYSVSYRYTSLVDFSYDFIYGVYCFSVPNSANSYDAYGYKHGYAYGSSTLYTQYLSTNFIDVFMSHGSLISTPIVNATLGGAVTYNNPDGSTTSSPSKAPDNGSIYTAYNASAVNPVIDRCSYSGAYGWTTRSVNIKISKPGLYWLSFSAQGDPLTALGAGPGIDDVILTALGSPSMSNPPTSPLAAIPVPDPQPDSAYGPGSNPGYLIVADPFRPPGADL